MKNSKCSEKVRTHSPVLVLQSFAVSTCDVVSTDWPVPEKTAVKTLRTSPENVRMHSPVLVLQSFAVLSLEAVSMDWPSAEKAAENV